MRSNDIPEMRSEENSEISGRLEKYFPIWDKLTSEERQLLVGSATERSVKAGSGPSYNAPAQRQ
jgi:hypothetical protein